MQRVCFTLTVRPDKMEEYKARHRDVWPEMQQALRDAGWHNYSLFLRPDGLLIGYLETPDLDIAIQKMKHHAVNALWQKEMAPFFVFPSGSAPDETPDESMVPLEEVFHLDLKVIDSH